MTFTASLDDLVEENDKGLLGAHETWLRVPLRQVATVINGFAFPSSRFTPDQGTPLLRIRDILTDRTEARFDGEYDPRYLVNTGDLVVGMDGDFNCALWRGSEALLNQRVCRIEPDE